MTFSVTCRLLPKNWVGDSDVEQRRIRRLLAGAAEEAATKQVLGERFIQVEVDLLGTDGDPWHLSFEFDSDGLSLEAQSELTEAVDSLILGITGSDVWENRHRTTVILKTREFLQSNEKWLDADAFLDSTEFVVKSRVEYHANRHRLGAAFLDIVFEGENTIFRFSDNFEEANRACVSTYIETQRTATKLHL